VQRKIDAIGTASWDAIFDEVAIIGNKEQNFQAEMMRDQRQGGKHEMPTMVKTFDTASPKQFGPLTKEEAKAKAQAQFIDPLVEVTTAHKD
jgi:hypothetical protein